MGEACFSGNALALLGVIATPIASVVAMLWRDNNKAKSEERADLILQRDTLLKRLEDTEPVLADATRVVQRKRRGE